MVRTASRALRNLRAKMPRGSGGVDRPERNPVLPKVPGTRDILNDPADPDILTPEGRKSPEEDA